ncbi:MAG: hypothetical protein PVI40_08655 [Chlamydiota bacterium]|jgi:hypothetical protein
MANEVNPTSNPLGQVSKPTPSRQILDQQKINQACAEICMRRVPKTITSDYFGNTVPAFENWSADCVEKQAKNYFICVQKCKNCMQELAQRKAGE